MKRRFTLSSQAEADIDATAGYLARNNIDAALRFYDAVWSTLDGLAEMPGKGRPRELSDPSLAQVRSCTIGGFESILVFYVPTGDGVQVLRVMHGARDIDAQFGRR